MNGKIDFAKGSYYNNPMSDIPPTDDPSYIDKHPEYGHPNVWPKELPQLREEFMDVSFALLSLGT